MMESSAIPEEELIKSSDIDEEETTDEIPYGGRANPNTMAGAILELTSLSSKYLLLLLP
jgi:hypothetical protein